MIWSTHAFWFRPKSTSNLRVAPRPYTVVLCHPRTSLSELRQPPIRADKSGDRFATSPWRSEVAIVCVGEPRLRHTRVGGSTRQVVGGWVAREPMHSSKEWSSMTCLCVCALFCSSARCPLCLCTCCIRFFSWLMVFVCINLVSWCENCSVFGMWSIEWNRFYLLLYFGIGFSMVV